MDFSIRLRTAEDELAEKRVEMKTLITPAQKPNRSLRGPTTVVRRGDKLVRIPASQVSQSCDGA
jgi:hypothetical protein